MAKTNLGAVTAYADAVAQGYTGTREQFGKDQAAMAEAVGAQKIHRTGSNTEFEIGKMIYSNGKEYENISLAVTGYFPAFPGEKVTANHHSDDAGNVFTDFVCEYSGTSAESFIKRTNIEKNGSVVLGETTRYIRFSFGRSTASGIAFTEADKAYFDVNITRVSFDGLLGRAKEESEAAVGGLAGEIDAELLQTLNNRMEATSADSMDDLTNVGIYGWTASQRPYDCPVSDTGLLVVVQYSKANKPEYGRLEQILLCSYGMYHRFRSTTAWTEWQCGNYLVTGDSIKMNAGAKKCRSAFVPLKDVETASTSLPVFTAETAYSGVPYSSVQPLATDAFYDMSLDALFSMFNNPDSAIYGYTNPLGGDTSKVYAGGVCSSFVSWITGQPVIYTTYDIIKILDYKTINDIEDIEIGDVLICHTKWDDTQDHAMVVSNIIASVDGVNAVEIAEMWPPVFRKVLYDKKKFMGLLDGTTRSGDRYRVGRFPNQKIRTIPPVVINTDIVTEYGDNMYFESGEDVFIQSKNSVITVKSPSGVESSVDLSVLPVKSGTAMYNIASVLNEVGRWTLYGTGGEESHVTIIKKGTVTLADGKVSVSGYEGCTPCGYITVVLRTDGVGNYETHSDNPAYTASRLTVYSKEDPRYTGAMDGSGVTINTSAIDEYVGYYVRVFYDTGCGQAHMDSDVVYF